MFFKNCIKPDSGDFACEREQMVREQLEFRGIKNRAVLEAMLTVPRHLFVPEHLRKYAHYDGPLAIGEGQTISQPYMVALMVEALEPQAGDWILEVGTGSGYAAAVLSRIVSRVFTVERHRSLALGAVRRFRLLGYDNIDVYVGDGTKGWPAEALFDGILVSAAAPAIPASLRNQLKPGGCLVIPVGGRGYQELLRLRLERDGSSVQDSLGAVQFVPLVGEEGWNTEY